MSQQQLQIDFPRLTRRDWLKRMIIPRFRRELDGRMRLARTDLMNRLLLELEWATYGKTPDCRLFLNEVAKLINKSPQTARRTIDACKALGLLIVETSFDVRVPTRYEIDWCRVKEVVIENPETAQLIIVPTRPQKPVEKPADTPSKLEGVNSKLEGVNSKLEGVNSKLEGVAASHTYSSRARNHSSLGSSIKTSSENDGLKNDEIENRPGGWPIPITFEDLRNIRTVQFLWGFAQNQRWGHPPEARYKFFALARHLVHLKRSGTVPIDNIGALFTSEVIKAAEPPYTWSKYVTLDDEDAAKRAISKLDGRTYNPNED